jgi:hypothetical protein
MLFKLLFEDDENLYQKALIEAIECIMHESQESLLPQQLSANDIKYDSSTTKIVDKITNYIKRTWPAYLAMATATLGGVIGY